MPQNAYTDDVPLDLQLDLLVDGELPESRRRALLASLDGKPDQWRTVALRFLQHQTEKQTVGALMAGGNLMPEAVATPVVARRPIIGRIGRRRLMAVAAGLLIAASSALVTLMTVRTGVTDSGFASIKEFRTAIPAELVDSDRAVAVSVPVVPAGDNAAIFPVNHVNRRGPARTTVLVQPDGKDGFMVIPVSSTKTPVY